MEAKVSILHILKCCTEVQIWGTCISILCNFILPQLTWNVVVFAPALLFDKSLCGFRLLIACMLKANNRGREISLDYAYFLVVIYLISWSILIWHVTEYFYTVILLLWPGASTSSTSGSQVQSQLWTLCLFWADLNFNLENKWNTNVLLWFCHLKQIISPSAEGNSSRAYLGLSPSHSCPSCLIHWNK